jgi:hypothetical protein
MLKYPEEHGMLRIWTDSQYRPIKNMTHDGKYKGDKFTLSPTGVITYSVTEFAPDERYQQTNILEKPFMKVGESFSVLSNRETYEEIWEIFGIKEMGRKPKKPKLPGPHFIQGGAPQ